MEKSIVFNVPQLNSEIIIKNLKVATKYNQKRLYWELRLFQKVDPYHIHVFKATLIYNTQSFLIYKNIFPLHCQVMTESFHLSLHVPKN